MLSASMTGATEGDMVLAFGRAEGAAAGVGASALGRLIVACGVLALSFPTARATGAATVSLTQLQAASGCTP